MLVNLQFGDCFRVLETLPDGCVDMVLCDPPYGTTRCAWDTPLDLDALWKHYRRVVKPNGAVLIFAQTPFDKVLGASNLAELRYELIWRKTRGTGFLNANRAPLKAHENILVFYRSLPSYTPEKSTGHARKVSTKSGVQGEIYGKMSGGSMRYDSTERYPLSVVEYAAPHQTDRVHPTQKPVDLLRYLIRLYSRPGDLILDNCMGSGSTGVAALAEGRRFIGIEKEPEYFAICQDRIEQALVAA